MRNKKNTPIIKNASYSFLFGGVISLIGQLLIAFNEQMLHLEVKDARSLMTLQLILVASLLTGLNLYDKIGQIACSGTVIPITGFANSMTSSAMEYKPEGFFLGICANVFKLAGSVIACGVFLELLFH